MKRILLITAGLFALTLGVIGVAVPVLPTTPFILLAAACFFRSSDTLYRWMINHQIFGEYIRSYRQYRAIPVRAKIISIFMLWLFISFSVFFVVRVLWVNILLLLIATGVTIYILNHRTLTPEMREEHK
ncbi:MAG: YbaN family protein [Chitinivibrionales bacterium]